MVLAARKRRERRGALSVGFLAGKRSVHVTALAG
jgi:hypothetical protein